MMIIEGEDNFTCEYSDEHSAVVYYYLYTGVQNLY